MYNLMWNFRNNPKKFEISQKKKKKIQKLRLFGQLKKNVFCLTSSMISFLISGSVPNSRSLKKKRRKIPAVSKTKFFEENIREK